MTEAQWFKYLRVLAKELVESATPSPDDAGKFIEGFWKTKQGENLLAAMCASQCSEEVLVSFFESSILELLTGSEQS